MSNYPQQITIVEVGPRDGLQNTTKSLDPRSRIQYINRLADSGLGVIEAGALVSPKWVPAMADTDRVIQGMEQRPGIRYPVLVPNMRGLEQALECGISEIAIFAAASQSFSRKNINASIEESLKRYGPVCEQALTAKLRVRGYISCVLGCPYEGSIKPQQVAMVAQRLADLGCHEISLGDTIGTGTPLAAQHMVSAVQRVLPHLPLAAHFHDTYGQALANLLAVMELGITIIDSAAGGLGGCPYAPGAAGNVATEDVLYMLDGMNITTGVDVTSVVSAAQYMASALGTKITSRVGMALTGRGDRWNSTPDELV